MIEKFSEERSVLVAVALLLLGWITVPPLLQYRYGVSAPLSAMTIAFLYYFVYKLVEKDIL